MNSPNGVKWEMFPLWSFFEVVALVIDCSCHDLVHSCLGSLLIALLLVGAGIGRSYLFRRGRKSEIELVLRLSKSTSHLLYMIDRILWFDL